MNATSLNVTTSRQKFPENFDVLLFFYIEFIVHGVMLTLISVLGVVANVLSLIVLSKPQMRSAINCCLQGLAVFDGTMVFTTMLMLGIPCMGRRPLGLQACFKYNRYVLPHLSPALYPLSIMAHAGSVWTTVCVTVERYIAVCHPLRARSVCTYRRARLAMLLVTFLAILYGIPRFFERDKVLRHDYITNETYYGFKASSLRRNKLYVNIYHVWLCLMMLIFIPAVTLTVLNFRIWRTVRKANSRRQSLTSHQKNERRLVYMLFCVVLVFFGCNILAPVVNILEYVDDRNNLLMIMPFSNCLVNINSSVNFFIYCIYCNKFRHILIRMLCRKKQRALRHQNGSSGRRATLSTLALSQRRSRSSKRSSLDTKSSILNGS